MKYFAGTFLFFIMVLALTAPSVLLAQGLVTCDGIAAEGVECNFCTFAAMFERVINFATALLILIAVIMLAITGVQMAYTAANNGDALTLLKERMTRIFLGFLLILASWTIVDTLIKVLVVDPEVVGWREFITSGSSELCGKQLVPQETALDQSGSGSSYGDGDAFLAGAGLSEEEARRRLEAAGVKIKDEGAGAQLQGVRPHVIDEIIKLNQACGCNITVTEGTGGTHSTEGDFTHVNGFKLDLRTRDNPDLVRYVESLSPAGQWGDGTKLYKDVLSCATYAVEGDHIDVVYKTGCRNLEF